MAGGVLHRRSTHTKNKKVAQQWAENISLARRAPTFDEAVEVLKILYNKHDNAIKLDAAWETYEQLAKAVGKLDIRPKTIRDRRCDLGHFIEWIRRNSAKVTTVEGVTGAMAVAYAEELARDKSKKSHTRKNIISNLSCIWNMLEKTSPRISNHWKNIAPKITDGTRIQNFSRKQEKAVLEAAKKIGKDWFPVCVIARHTGMRYGSIARLTWKEVDLDAGIIRHKPTKTERYDIALELPIIKPMRDALKSVKREGEYLFPLHAELYGSHTKSKYDMLNFKEVLTEAGIEGNYTFHSWRHTASTHLAKAGADIETRKKILGHTQDSTAARYDHDDHLAKMRKAMVAASNE